MQWSKAVTCFHCRYITYRLLSPSRPPPASPQTRSPPRPPRPHHDLTTTSPRPHHDLTTTSPTSPQTRSPPRPPRPHHDLTTTSPRPHHDLTNKPADSLTTTTAKPFATTSLASPPTRSPPRPSPRRPASATRRLPLDHFPDPVFLGENDPSPFILIDPPTNKKTPLAKGERGQSQ